MLLHMLQGKRHQQNLAKRAAREAAEKQAAPAPQRRVQIKKTGAGDA
jgi:splicing factor 3A subunit 2